MGLPGSCSFKGGVCSEVDGVDALRVRLMFTFCIFFLLPAPKEGSTVVNGVHVLTEIGWIDRCPIYLHRIDILDRQTDSLCGYL